MISEPDYRASGSKHSYAAHCIDFMPGILLNGALVAHNRGLMMAITDAEIEEWRAEQGNGMNSAVGEYTPAEFWSLLDEVEVLRTAAFRVVAHMEGRQPVRGWLKDNNASRDALAALVKAVGAA